MNNSIYRKDRAAGLPNPPAAYCIFFHPYLCTVPKIHLMADIHFREIGVGSTGNKATDNEMLGEMITTYITIARMVELHHDGVNITIESPEQAVGIYRVLKQHLTDWDLELTHSINRRQPPTEALIAMDNFADSLWNVAKFYVKEEIHSVSLFKALSDLDRTNRLVRNKLEILIHSGVDHTDTKHNPFKASLAKHDANMRKQYDGN